MNGGDSFDTSILERLWEESLSESGAQVESLEQAVKVRCPDGNLTIERYKVSVAQIEGVPGGSIAAEVRCKAEHDKHGALESRELFPLMAENVEEGIRAIANTVLETTATAWRVYLGESVESQLNLGLSSRTTGAEAVEWNVSASKMHFTPDSLGTDKDFVKELMRLPVSAITDSLGEPRVHWMSWSLRRNRDGKFSADCIIDGEYSKAGVVGLQDGWSKIPQRPEGVWEIQQFVVVEPGGQADPKAVEELEAYHSEQADLSQVYPSREQSGIDARFAPLEIDPEGLPDGDITEKSTSFATSAPHIALSSWRYARVLPAGRLLTKITIIAILATVVSVKLDSMTAAAISCVLALLFGWLWHRFLQVSRDKYKNALLTPGIIVNTNPTEVVVMAPLTKSSGAPDKGLAFKLLIPKKLPIHDHHPGVRVPCVSTFTDRDGSEHYWGDFFPEPLSWGTGSKEELERCAAKIDPVEFALLEKNVKEGYYPRQEDNVQRLRDSEQTNGARANDGKTAFAMLDLPRYLEAESRAEFLDTLVHEKGRATMMAQLWEGFFTNLSKEVPSSNGIDGHVYRHGDYLVAIMMLPKPTVSPEPTNVAALVGPLPKAPWSRESMNTAPLRYYVTFPVRRDRLGVAMQTDSDKKPALTGVQIDANVSDILDWIESQTEVG